MAAFAIQADQGEMLSVVGDQVRMFADAEATGGKVVIFETRTQPGMGPPLHCHGIDDEYFFVIEGHVRFVVDGREFRLGPGAFAHAPKGSIHTFTNAGTGLLRMLVICTPPGLEQPFRAVHAMGPEGQTNMPAVIEAFARHSLTIHGPPLGPG
jgi:mannose-6-phosphate isomerase-like protein (cupin superfamily)